ncbi:MAG: 50S ribosomal protein L10 [Firmicutes bacterium]|nr:50S ribosomal protein L10 [Bacillota bacterium]
MSKESIALKEKEVAEIVGKIKRAKSVILIDYRGITVFDDTRMRNALRAEKIEYKVIKNRIMLRAFNATGYAGFDKTLEGPTAVAFGYADAVAPAKILTETAKKLNKMAVKGGVAEGRKLSVADVMNLAKMPPKPVLVGQLLGMLTSPMRSLAVALAEVAKKKA